MSAARTPPVPRKSPWIKSSWSRNGLAAFIVLAVAGGGLYFYRQREAMASTGAYRSAKVERGDLIGHVGATGRATGYHLHYEVLANGRLLNPLQLLTQNKPRDR